ncbi:hypothetical protein AC249_AIPGENE16702 [Exaiptasia diaphana]|nr:hypothetical protein AC249_AIPGENE16702 [Exaiptasia diaphana]
MAPEPRSNQNKSAEGMQQRSIPDAFEYDYVAMDGDLRFVNNRTKGMCQHSIPVRRTHNKEDIPTPANHEPNEYINKKGDPEDGLSSESAYQPLQIKSPEDGVYQSLDKTSRAVNASERR